MKRRLMLASLAALLAAGALVAGPLTPGGGPVASTYKTLAEVEPRIAINATTTPGDADSVYKISNPGSYYLTDLLLIPPGKMGIEILNDDVTIDLNGYRIGGISGVIAGIRASGNRRNIVIKNGIIENCVGGAGIELTRVNNFSHSCRVEDVTIRDCTGHGLRMGDGCIARGVLASNNGDDGINASDNCVVDGCSATDNAGAGISLGGNCTITRCSASGNQDRGIWVYSGTIEGCAASDNNMGGIELSFGTVRNCVSRSNWENPGISLGADCIVEGCSVTGNHASGIEGGSRCVIRGNLVTFSQDSGTAIGIWAYEESCVDDNHVQFCDVGIRVTGEHSVITRNRVRNSGSSNWSIGVNNFYGPIIDRSAATSSGVLSNSASGTLGSSDPNANFSN